MKTFFSKMPWWAWVAVAVALFFSYQALTGSAMTSNLWKQVFGQIKDDQTKVVKTLEDNQKMYEDEIVRLGEQLKKVQNDRAALQKQKEELLNQDRVKDAEIEKLRAARQTIVVPVDPDALVNDLRGMGFGSVKYRR